MKLHVFAVFFTVLTFLQATNSLPIDLDIATMTLDEKIGQMLIVAAVPNLERNAQFIPTVDYYAEPAYAQEMIAKFNIGGVLIIGESTPEEHVVLINSLQAKSKYPLFILCDTTECSGLSMRMKQNITVYPKAMTLGALDPADDYLIYDLGSKIAAENQSIGIHCGLGPVADVNNNPNNPIINTRSFGENPTIVAHKALLFMKGLKAHHVLTCIKHWPGHGNTEQDSHVVLPHLKANFEQLKTIELIPFQQAIDNDIDMVMTAHLNVPALTHHELPVSLSQNAINFLRKEMGHTKLIITDGLGMKGVTSQYRPEEIAVQAIKAGNDLLLCPVDIARAFCALKIAVKKGEITEHEINEHVHRIIVAKKAAQIKKTITLHPDQLISRDAQQLKKSLYTGAITLARNDNDYLPLKNTQDVISIITIAQNPDMVKPFLAALQPSLKINHYALSINASQDECKQLLQKLNNDPHVIISIHLASRSGMIELREKKVPAYVEFINQLTNKVTLILFGNPYNLAYIPSTNATIIAYENEPEAQEAAAQTLMGKHNPRGHLPVSTYGYPAGTSLGYTGLNN